MFPNNPLLALLLSVQGALCHSPIDDYANLFGENQTPLSDHQESPLSPSFNDLVTSTLDHWHVPGLSISIVDGNSTYAKVSPLLSFHPPSPLLTIPRATASPPTHPLPSPPQPSSTPAPQPKPLQPPPSPSSSTTASTPPSPSLGGHPFPLLFATTSS